MISFESFGRVSARSQVEMDMDPVLIIEDDADQAEMVAQLLRLKGYPSRWAETGGDGLRVARESPVSLILLDLMLPDRDGFQICRELRGDLSSIKTPIVMLTALDGSLHREKGFRVGANAYLTKPFSAEDLYRAIDLAHAWRHDLERSGITGEIRVELNSEPRFLHEVNDFLTNLALGTPLGSEAVMQLRQAIMELGQNAIEWGNRHRSEKLVTILYRVHTDRVEITIRDQGPGFKRGELPHAASAEDPLSHMDVREKLGLRDGGFGLMICEGMVDELKFNETGNEVKLTKKFQSDLADSV